MRMSMKAGDLGYLTASPSEVIIYPMDELTALIQARMNEAGASVAPDINASLEDYTNSSVLAFKEKFKYVTEENKFVSQTRIQDHLATIVARLLVTTRLSREITYGELYKAMSQRIRNKFDIALTVLVREGLVLENAKRGKCYYKLNVLIQEIKA